MPSFWLFFSSTLFVALFLSEDCTIRRPAVELNLRTGRTRPAGTMGVGADPECVEREAPRTAARIVGWTLGTLPVMALLFYFFGKRKFLSDSSNYFVEEELCEGSAARKFLTVLFSLGLTLLILVGIVFPAFLP